MCKDEGVKVCSPTQQSGDTVPPLHRTQAGSAATQPTGTERELWGNRNCGRRHVCLVALSLSSLLFHVAITPHLRALFGVNV